jgi:hypothetical protein
MIVMSAGNGLDDDDPFDHGIGSVHLVDTRTLMLRMRYADGSFWPGIVWGETVFIDFDVDFSLD